jgi:hypothetical protein
MKQNSARPASYCSLLSSRLFGWGNHAGWIAYLINSVPHKTDYLHFPTYTHVQRIILTASRKLGVTRFPEVRKLTVSLPRHCKLKCVRTHNRNSGKISVSYSGDPGFKSCSADQLILSHSPFWFRLGPRDRKRDSTSYNVIPPLSITFPIRYSLPFGSMYLSFWPYRQTINK